MPKAKKKELLAETLYKNGLTVERILFTNLKVVARPTALWGVEFDFYLLMTDQKWQKIRTIGESAMKTLGGDITKLSKLLKSY